MDNYIQIEEFLDLAKTIPVIDVRAPIEYNHAHIPGAFNLPLFDDKEREKVGTLYKHKGRDEAILCGLEMVGLKLRDLVIAAKKIAKENQVLVHCWRGGMRSSSMAWLLNTAGIQAKILTGGYKTYRRHVKAAFQKKAKLLVLGGMTGSGKTDILQFLQQKDLQVIDLEKLANHKGSAFGALGQEDQCSTEQFENLLYQEWQKLDLNKTIWIEDESQAIGKIRLPEEIYSQIRSADIINLIMPKELRIERLHQDYGNFDKDQLIESIQKINKRLGGLNMQNAIEAVKNNDIRTAIDLSLIYYDKAYLFGLSKRENQTMHDLTVNSIDPEENARKIIALAEHLGY